MFANAAAQNPYNCLPHIDTLVKSGIRSVQRDLPELPNTFWSLKHKHFDLSKNEVLVFETTPDCINVFVTVKSKVSGMWPCQAFYHDGEWEIVGYTATKCHFTIPDYEGSGMVSAILKKGRWMEYTSPESRVQTFEKWDGSLEENEEVIVTGIADKTMLNCVKCKTSDYHMKSTARLLKLAQRNLSTSI